MTRLRNLFSGYEPVKSISDEAAAIMLVLLIAIPTGIIFSGINAIYHFETLSLVLAVTSLMLIPCYILLRIGRTIPNIRTLLMAAAFVVFASLFIEGGIGDLGIFWSLIFPFFSFLLMGVRRGWIWVGMFLLLQTVLYALNAMQLFYLPYSGETLQIFPAMFIFFTLIGAVFELQNERHRYNLLNTNRELTESEQELRCAKENMEQLIFQRTRELQDANAQLVQEVKEKTNALKSMELAEEKFQHAQRMEAIGTLVGGIAHDFNNMLSGITANLFMAQRLMETDEGKERLNKIGDLAMLAADMIKQLLTFARKDEAELKEFDLTRFINEAYKLAVVSIPENIDCQYSFGKEPMPINGNATQIQQILMNLMNNARDAMAGTRNPAIRVSLTLFEPGPQFVQSHIGAQMEPYALLEIEDNGPGMDQMTCDRIFDPFFTTKEAGKGTGLGLAMVYGAMQSHHGIIEVTSEPGHGACFRLYFPIIHTKPTEQHSAAPATLHRGNGELILLADDNKLLRESESEALRALGYRVLTAENGLEATRLYRQHQDEIALIILDVVMPVMGGAAAAKRIRKRNADATIIFLSGYDRDHDMTTELMPEGNQLLTKPVSIHDLSRAICEQLTGI